MIRTVLGDIDNESLSTTYCHEHFLMTGGWPVMNEPDYRLNSIPAAIEEIEATKKFGFKSAVELTPIGFGRCAEGMREIASKTGLNIIASTGLHKVAYYADNHWLHTYSADEISKLLISEVIEGLDENNLEGPRIKRSKAKAGVVKVATLYQRIGRSMDKYIEAVGATHVATGVPISTHNDKGTLGHEVLDALEKHGVSASAVMLGHVDHNPDPIYLAELASRGAFLILDRPGRIKYAPDSDTVELVRELVAKGHASQILFGSDLARRSYWKSLGGGPGLTYLLENFRKRLAVEGLEKEATLAFDKNPATALSFRGTK